MERVADIMTTAMLTVHACQNCARQGKVRRGDAAFKTCLAEPTPACGNLLKASVILTASLSIITLGYERPNGRTLFASPTLTSFLKIL